MANILVWSCGHADPSIGNERFGWLGNYIYEHRKSIDMCIDLGDGADMRSLNSFDTRYPQAIVSQNYEYDIECYLDSQQRLRENFTRNKKGKPYWVGFEGNHENRIKTAIKHDPRLEGQKYGISFSHLRTKEFFKDYHEYQHSAPKISNYCGVDFAHFFGAGNFGKPMSGIHHAYTIINKRHNSGVCGHSHLRGVYFNDLAGSIGLVVGCYKGGPESWAGQSNKSWWKGVVLMKDTHNGMFEPEFISQEELERDYS